MSSSMSSPMSDPTFDLTPTPMPSLTPQRTSAPTTPTPAADPAQNPTGPITSPGLLGAAQGGTVAPPAEPGPGEMIEPQPGARECTPAAPGPPSPSSPPDTDHAEPRWRDDTGMSTVEYAIGIVAAAAFAAILYSVISGDSVVAALTGLVQRALSTEF